MGGSEIGAKKGPPVAVPKYCTAGQLCPLGVQAQLWDAFQWVRSLGWPRRFPIVQFPNLPLALAFVAGQAAHHVRGAAHGYAMAVSYLAMAVWAYLELFDGVNWFRRLLGAYYAASTAIHLGHHLTT